MNISEELKDKIKKIKILITDVDGILTDGSYYVGDMGEFKRYHASDGAAIVTARYADLPIAIISGRKSGSTTRRCKELSIPESLVYQGYMNKMEPYKEIIKKFNVSDENVAYVGDDLIDEPLLLKAGVSFSVPNARFEIKEIADMVTVVKGGDGAIKEIIELILKVQNKFEPALNKLRNHYKQKTK
ncbi:MAG: HAD hydrolase family protein [Candidatus Marinimicrobia bacterium]|nr:HAD hydrolase family protein [Candidatus Neomarinimicrobiota bacterium]